MASHEGSESPPPAAWVWSHYRGITTAGAGHGDSSATAETTAARHSIFVGAGLATAVVVLTGLTWLFTNQPREQPAPLPAALERVEAPVVPASDAPKPEPKPAETAAPKPAETPAPKAAETAAPVPAVEAAPAPAPVAASPAPSAEPVSRPVAEPAHETPKAAPAPAQEHLKHLKKRKRQRR